MIKGRISCKQQLDSNGGSMKTRRIQKWTVWSVVGFAMGGLLVVGCATSGGKGGPAAGLSASGAQLWAENCQRCHNYRSPSSLSDAEWAIAMHHMRVRANLTAEEHNKVLEFLESAN